MSTHYLPFSSQNIPVVTELPPFEFCPDVTSSWYHYANTIHASNVVWLSAVAERLKLTVTINFADYLVAAIAAGYSGTFDTNFNGITICVTDTVPTGLPNCSETIGELTHTSNTTDWISTLVLRSPEDWAGKNRYVNFVIHFIHDGQDDYVVVPFKIYTSAQNYLLFTDEAPFTQIQLVKDGQVIDTLCSDGTKDVIEIWADHNQVGAVPLVVMQREGIFGEEYDGFDSTNLPKLVEAPFLSIDSEIITGGQREVIRINESELIGGECIFVVIKPEPIISGPFPPTCEAAFDIEAEIAVFKTGSPSKYTVQVDYSIDPVFADLVSVTWVAEIGICTLTGSSDQNVDTVTTNTSATSCFSNIVTLTVEVLLETGCSYTQSYTFAINPALSINTKTHTYTFV